jgi:PEP-CTERM motif-containing protein
MFAKTLGRKITVCAALALGSMGTAHAIPAYWDDWAGKEGTYIDAEHSYSYTHDIRDASSGSYRPGIDSISSATLTIWLYDDAFFGDLPLLGDGQETVGFKLDGGSWSSSSPVNGNAIPFFWDDFDFIVTSLVSDGMLNVKIRSNRGDFQFGASHLEAWGNKSGGRSVPEPATLSLFGLGLLGLGFAARRRKV